MCNLGWTWQKLDVLHHAHLKQIYWLFDFWYHHNELCHQIWLIEKVEWQVCALKNQKDVIRRTDQSFLINIHGPIYCMARLNFVPWGKLRSRDLNLISTWIRPDIGCWMLPIFNLLPWNRFLARRLMLSLRLTDVGWLSVTSVKCELKCINFFSIFTT